MYIPRANPDLHSPIEVLDARFNDISDSSDKFQRVWDSLHDDELQFVANEIYKCKTDVRYFINNYYVIKDQHGELMAMHTLRDQQEEIYCVVQELWQKQGWFKIIILKPRQCGGTTFSDGIILQATIFVERMFSIVMAQDEDTSAELYRRLLDALNWLPWWMRPERESKQQERHIVFQRKDEKRRMVDPGLASTMIISNSQKAAGVAIGRTVRAGHFSEVSRWPDPTVWTADIEPSMNARDTRAFMESTAYGRTGLFWHMWRAAEAGKSDWTPVFIPVYKVRKYFTPVLKGEDFQLDSEEKALRASVKHKENFTIPLGFFKWRRRKRQAVINAEGRDDTFFESYPSTPGEAFINSGFCAFPKKCLNEQEREHCYDPILIGEIGYTGPDSLPELRLHKPESNEIMDKPDRQSRFWVWEEPDQNDAVEYYLGCDVSSGDGRDYTDIVVYRIGYGPEPHVQVCEWHGLANPSHVARIVAAIGYWYHTCEVAVEYQGPGITTGDELRLVIDYVNLYRWKTADRLNSTTQHIHWLTNSRTREDMINRMNEALLDRTVILRNRHLIEEMRDFGWEERDTRAEAMSGNDDMVAANCIAICALHQSGKRQEWAENNLGANITRHPNALPSTPAIYAVYDKFGLQCSPQHYESESEADKFIAAAELKYNRKLRDVWKVVPIQVSRANTFWSPIWQNDGAEHELAAIHGFDGRSQMMHPDVVSAVRKKLHIESKFGNVYSIAELDDDN